jgi:7-cyano-7-deazaguanine synthase in queuosine biosynthesis
MKAVILLSGGKDSLAAAMLTHDKYELHALFVDVGEPTTVAHLVVSQRIAKKYCVSHKTIGLTGGPFTGASRNKMGMISSVPYRSLVMISLGAMFAGTLDAAVLISGVKGDAQMDWWHHAASLVLNMSRVRPPITLVSPIPAPSIGDDAVLQIVKDEPLWKETVYCRYVPPCGTCYGCELRKSWLERSS